MPDVYVLTARPHRLLQPLIERVGELHARGERVMLLVPEQLTLEAERELMKRLHLGGFFTIDVLSPSRLGERVLQEVGRDEREPLSDAGRRMAISRTLERLQGKLGYYGSITGRRGFVDKLAAIIADMKRGGLTPEALKQRADALQAGVTKHKLTDLSLIYESYEALLSGRFSDGDDKLGYVASRLSGSAEMHETHMLVYGFDTLSEQLSRLLCAAAAVCPSLTVALVCDSESAGDGELYLPIRQSIARFSERLKQAGLALKLEAEKPRPLDSAAAIRHIDESLFALSPKRFAGEARGVYCFTGLSPFEEATVMTRQVLRLIKDGANPERIAVLAPDSDGYAFAVPAALRLSGVPFYTDRLLPAASHGLARYLMCALRAASGGYRGEDVLGMIKSGFSPLSFEEGCELQNYAYCYGINLKRWTQPFTRGENAARMRCEELRQRLIAPVERTRAALVAARSTVDSMTAVYGLLSDAGAYETLKREEERLVADGMLTRAAQNSQIWQAMLSLMDELVRIGDGARVPLKHIADRLECGFAAISLKALPPAGGMLHAGTLGHSLNVEADYVFLLGLNDGVLRRDIASLLTDEERADTQSATGCHLGLTAQSLACMARLDIKTAMTLPKRELYLSYAKTDASGGALRPDSLIGIISKRLFDELPQSPVAIDALPMSAAQALSELGLSLRAYADGIESGEAGERRRGLARVLLSDPATANAAQRVLRAMDSDGGAQPLTPDEARALYGDEALSVSRLEEFASCPFKHFMTYGLRPVRLREWRVDPIETGTFYHAGLNSFAKLAAKEPSFPALDDERVAALMDEAVKPLVSELMQGPMGDGERALKRYELACGALRRAGVTIARQLAAGCFSMYMTEATFGYEGGLPPIILSLSDGREVALRGRIDRVDRYDAPEATYLRVIDYKSSKQNLDAARTWWGLQLQLLLYLDVCAAAVPGSKPAGAFYFYVADPIVESENDLRELVEDKLRTLLMLKGITLSEVEVMDATDAGETPCVLPPVFLKTGELKKDARALSLNQMNALMRHAKETAEQLASRLYGGETDVSPVRDGDMAPCAYCDYSSVCRFDAQASDAPYRDVPDLGMDDLRELLGD